MSANDCPLCDGTWVLGPDGAPVEPARKCTHPPVLDQDETGAAVGYAAAHAINVAHARREDPATSHQAAASLPSEKLRASQQAVLQLLRRIGPATDETIAEKYGSGATGVPRQSASGLRTRRNELVAQGLVRDTGRRERLASGRNGNVWEAV